MHDILFQLTIHVGVSGITEDLKLEQQAHNIGYEKQDNCGCVPDSGMCCQGKYC